jgi:hypothetical protein
MTLEEAKEATTAYITFEAAKLWAQTTDKMVWVECHIMAPAGVQSSVCNDFGENLCKWIEGQLENFLK